MLVVEPGRGLGNHDFQPKHQSAFSFFAYESNCVFLTSSRSYRVFWELFFELLLSGYFVPKENRKEGIKPSAINQPDFPIQIHLFLFYRKFPLGRVGGAGTGPQGSHLPRVRCQPVGVGHQAHGCRRPHGVSKQRPLPLILPTLPRDCEPRHTGRANFAGGHQSSTYL